MLTNRNRNTSTSNIRLLFAPFDIVEVILFQGLQKKKKVFFFDRFKP